MTCQNFGRTPPKKTSENEEVQISSRRFFPPSRLLNFRKWRDQKWDNKKFFQGGGGEKKLSPRKTFFFQKSATCQASTKFKKVEGEEMDFLRLLFSGNGVKDTYFHLVSLLWWY